MKKPDGLPVMQDSGVLTFMRALWALDHGLHKVSKQMNRGLGVTGPQRLALRAIERSPRISAGELATSLYIHPSTLTGILARLLKKGLIVNTPHPADARRSVISLTGKGRRLLRNKGGTVESSVERALARLSQREISVSRKVIGVIAKELSDELDPKR